MSTIPPSSILERIYESEINFELTTFWSGGFTWKLGDSINGYHADGNADTLSDAVLQLAAAAGRHFPDSVFAREFGGTDRGTFSKNPNQCQACLEESGRPGPLRTTTKPSIEFDLLFAARRKCPKCGTDVFFERDLLSGQA